MRASRNGIQQLSAAPWRSWARASRNEFSNCSPKFCKRHEASWCEDRRALLLHAAACARCCRPAAPLSSPAAFAMVEMEADTPVAAASSDDAPRSAPGGSADAPVEAEGSAPPAPRPPPAAPPDVGALVKAKASFAEGVDRVGKTLEAATELVNQTLQQLHAQEHGLRRKIRNSRSASHRRKLFTPRVTWTRSLFLDDGCVGRPALERLPSASCGRRQEALGQVPADREAAARVQQL